MGSGFRIICRIMQISESVIRHGSPRNCMHNLNYCSENPNPKKKLTVNPNHYSKCLTLISIFSA